MWQLKMQLKSPDAAEHLWDEDYWEKGMRSVVIPGEHLQHSGCKEPHSRAGWKPGA